MVTKIKRRRKRRRKELGNVRLRRIFKREDYASGFSIVHAKKLASLNQWPDQLEDIENVTRYVERFVRYEHQFIGYDTISTPHQYGDPLSSPLNSVLEQLSQHTYTLQWLDNFITDQQHADLWQNIEHRARELALLDQHKDWGDLENLESWQLFELIVIIVAEGMTYSRGIMGNDLNFEVGAGSSWLEGMELFLVSLFKVFTADFRSIWWLAQQPFKRGFTGMCRHYSLLVQVLFHVAKRALNKHHGTHVLTISGTHEFLVKYDHAWTWFVDSEKGQIVPVDLTGADWLYDRQMAKSVFNEGFDAYRFNNTSALFHSMISPLATTHQQDTAHAQEAIKHITNMCDARSIHGQALLLNWTRQNIFPQSPRTRLMAHIERHDPDNNLHLLAESNPSWIINKANNTMNPAIFHTILDSLDIE